MFRQPVSGFIINVSLRLSQQQIPSQSTLLVTPENFSRLPRKLIDERHNSPTRASSSVAFSNVKTVTTTPSLAQLIPMEQSAAEIVERARADIRKGSYSTREDPRQLVGGSVFHHPSPIERATAQPRQGIEQLADGLTRITLQGGRQYCLKDLPEIVKRDGPIVPMAVPMNCP